MNLKQFLCNLAVVLSAGLGLYLNFHEPNASKSTLLYFTTQSNLWMLAVCLLLLGYGLARRAVPRAVYFVKYLFTVAIAITGLVYNFILAPQFALYYGSLRSAYSVSVVLLHVVVPVLSLLSYLFFDEEAQKGSFGLWGLTMPLLYFGFILALAALVDPPLFEGLDGTPSKFPYFFMDYTANGWFTWGRGAAGLGVFYWLLLLLALTAALGWLLRRLRRRIRGGT